MGVFACCVCKKKNTAFVSCLRAVVKVPIFVRGRGFFWRWTWTKGLCRFPLPTLAWCLPSLPFSHILRYVSSVFLIVLFFSRFSGSLHMSNFLPKLLEWKKDTSLSRNALSHYVSCVGVVRPKPNGELQAADTPLSY